MNLTLTLAGLLSLAASTPCIQGADLSKYRNFQLGMPLADVAKESFAAKSDVKLISSRPERVEEMTWRVGWTPPSSDVARVPFSSVVFAFYNNSLYRISISYDRDRTRGLTDGDMVESISNVYGTTTLAAESKTADVIAQWEDTQSVVNLVRLPYYAGFGLVLSSKATLALAEQALLESARRDRIDAPQIEAALAAKRLADAQAADEQARQVNKPGFRP